MLQMLGTYRVEEKLADGGMGSVYLATAPDGRRVVLKVPHTQDKDAAIALSDEARTGARLRHPAIVETLDFFVDAGRSVLVVDFIDGVSLFELRRTGPLTPAAVVEIGAQIASALDAIHRAVDERGRPLQMLHRDVSPNNIIVDRNGQARLIDLGIARSAERKQKQTALGMVKGTLRYLSPEILRGGDHSAASDLWALGLTLWEAAVGRYAVSGDPMNTMRAAMENTMLRMEPLEHVDAALLEVIKVLVCPAEQRLQNARAATAVLTRMCEKFPGGRVALAEAVAVMGAQTGGVLVGDPTEVAELDNVGNRSQPGIRRLPHAESMEATALMARDGGSGGSGGAADVAGVFTTTAQRGAIASAIGTAPTQLMASVDADLAQVHAMAAAGAAAAAAVADVDELAGLPDVVEGDGTTTLDNQVTGVKPAPAPISALGPTEPSMPPARPPPPSQPAAAALASAPTAFQMPAARLATTIPAGSALATASRQSNAPVSAVAPTILQMPAAPAPASASAAAPTIQKMPVARVPTTVPNPLSGPVPSPSVDDATTDKEAALENAATIQMPMWTEPPQQAQPAAPQQPKPAAGAKPAASLFIPIVVVDEEGNE